MKTAVIIPAKNEKYLNHTIRDVMEKGDSVEVYVVLDGYEPEERVAGVTYLKVAEDGKPHLRDAINLAVRESTEPYLLKLDAHCLLDYHFDSKLIDAHQPDWVQVPRRYRLDAEKWKVIEDGRLPVDYEFILFQNLITNAGLDSNGFIWGSPWDDLAEQRRDVLIDNVPHFQGSCWFMSRSWFLQNGFLDLRYGGFAQEPEEILFTTIKSGGSVKVNKNTWYAHLHKDKEARGWFTMPPEDLAKGYVHSFNTWVMENRELFTSLIESFPPMPGWPREWKRILYGNA